MAVEIGRIGRWAGKNRIDCLNRSGKSRTDCRIVRFESRVVHAEASPTPDTPDLHGQTQQPEVCRGTRTAAIQSCRRMFFTTKHTKTGFVGHKRRLGKDVVPMLQPRFHLSAPHQWPRREGRNSLRPCPQACRLRSRRSATLPTRPNVDTPPQQRMYARVEASTGSRSRFHGDAFRREIPHAPQHGNRVNDGDEISPRNNLIPTKNRHI